MFEQIIWLVPVAVMALGLWTPKAGLLALVACLPLFGSPPGGPYLAALDVAALAAIATSLRRSKASPSDLNKPVMAFILVSVATLIPIAYHPPSFTPSILLGLVKVLPDVPKWTILFSWRALINLLIGWGLYSAVRRTFDRRSMPTLGDALAGGLGFVLVLGLAEHVGWIDLGTYRPIGGDIYETRLHSLFFHSGWLAEYVVLATPFAAAALLIRGRWRQSAGIVLLIVVLLALPFTEQRGAWFTALAQVSVLALVLGPRWIRKRGVLRPAMLIILSVFCLGLLLISVKPEVADPVVHRVSQATDHLSGRTDLWRVSVRLLAKRPFLGWGLGAFSPAYDLIYPPGSTEALHFRDTAHNIYFNIGAERGALGLVALAILAGAVWLGLIRSLRGDSDRDRYMALGLLLSAIGFGVMGLVQDMFYIKNIEWLFWILLGVTAITCPATDKGWIRLSTGALMWVTVLLVPWRLFFVSSPQMSGDRSFGFHQVEDSAIGNMQWTSERAVKRISWENEILVVPIANGHPRAAENPVQLTIRINGQDMVVETLHSGWKLVPIDVGPPRHESILVEFEVHPTFRPYSEFKKYPELEPSNDFRSLGITVGGMNWEGTVDRHGPDGQR